MAETETQLRPDRLPADMAFRLIIGEQEINLAGMTYADIFTTLRTVLAAVHDALHSQATTDEEAQTEQLTAAGTHAN